MRLKWNLSRYKIEDTALIHLIFKDYNTTLAFKKSEKSAHILELKKYRSGFGLKTIFLAFFIYTTIRQITVVFILDNIFRKALKFI